MKTLNEKIEEYVLKEIRRGLMFPLTDIQIIESDMYDRALNSAKFAVPLAMMEGYKEAMDYFTRKGDTGTAYDLAEFGKKIGIFVGDGN